MSSALPASQSTEDGSSVSHTAAFLSTADDTSVTTLEQRLLSDVDNWMAAFPSSSANFPGSSMTFSEVNTSATNDDLDRQRAVIWHMSQASRPPDVDSLLQGITSTQTGCSDTGSLRRMQRLRHVSADAHKSDSTNALNSQSELYSSGNQILQQTFNSSAATADLCMSDVSNAGQFGPKRRSSDHYPHGCNASDSVALANISKQRANSLQAVIQNTSGTQNVVLKSLDQSGNVGGNNFSFVAPLERMQSPHKQRQQETMTQSNTARQLVSGRKVAAVVEPSSQLHSAITDKMSSDKEWVVSKHVTFTEPKVLAEY